VTSGAAVTALTASDWNAFTSKIIAFAQYKNLGNSVGSFTSASSGGSITASKFNEAVAGLNVLDDYISQPIPTTKSAGNDIYASYIQALKTALNSIT
jgi:hypothetical protein